MGKDYKARDERRRREEEEYEARQQAEREKQAECAHYDCEVSRNNWDGSIAEVTCRECGAVNYLGG